MALVNLSVDGRTHSIDVEPDMPLLYALRDELGLNNPRFGCGLAQCGACTVLMDGQPIRACVEPVALMEAVTVLSLKEMSTILHFLTSVQNFYTICRIS